MHRHLRNPGAVGGNLCIFIQEEANVGVIGLKNLFSTAVLGAGVPTSPTGVTVAGIGGAAGLIVINGTWAVTAE